MSYGKIRREKVINGEIHFECLECKKFKTREGFYAQTRRVTPPTKCALCAYKARAYRGKTPAQILKMIKS